MQSHLIREALEKARLELLIRADVRYGREFLRLTGLAVGTTVKCTFPYSFGTMYKVNAGSKVMEGTIKQKQDKTLYVESNEDLTFAREVEGDRMYWEYYNAKGETSIDNILLPGE